MPTVLTSGPNQDGEPSRPPFPPHHHTPSNEEEVDVGACERDSGIRFCEIYSVPPKSVRSSVSKLGRGTFVEIDKEIGNFVHEFENGELWKF